jgi:glycosyltransferase involved in cell wall biosynthesis
LRLFPGRVYFKLLQLRLAFPVDFGCDSYFFPNFVGYPVRRGRTCVTVHDLSFLRYPQFTEPKNLTYLRMALPPALRRADRIVAVSQTTASDIEEFFGMGDKVTVIPNALSPAFRVIPEEEAAPVLEPHGLRRPFLLCVGTIEPRKNFDGAIRAFARLPADLSGSIDLVIAGGRGWRDTSFYTTLAGSPAKDRVKLIGGVNDEVLTALYNRALALIMPSHYEGFGLPLIEAMACDCPVLATNVSAMPEVAGDAALLIPAGDDEALTAGMERMLKDQALGAQLRQRGRPRIERFRPAPVVRQLLEVLTAA